MPQIAHIYKLDLPHVATVEFPANVQNPSKAIDMLGGSDKIHEAIENKQQLELRYRPNDPFEHPITSRTTKYQNLVLKVSISKKFLDEANGDIQKALQLSKNSYTATPAFISATNFRFREISDFQYTTVNSPFVQRVKNSIYAGDYNAIKEFEIEPFESIASDQIDAMPPPKFSQIVFPYNYGFRQNPSISIVDDGSGGSKLVSSVAPQKLLSIALSWGEPIPTKPSSELPKPEASVQACINELEKIFANRPIWTRSAIESLVSSELKPELRVALPYVSYSYTSGPWRRCYIKLGVDPASSQEYAKYQVEHYRVLNTRDINSLKQDMAKRKEKIEAERKAGNTNVIDDIPPSYIFNGKYLPMSTMIQLIDVTDPQLMPLIASARLIDECTDRDDGWYNKEDMTIIRKLLRIKLVACKNKEVVTNSMIEDVIAEEKAKLGANKEDENEDKDYNPESEDNMDIDKESNILQKLGNSVDGGSEKLKDLFGYVQQQGEEGSDADDTYMLMEDDDDEDEDEDDDDEDDDDE